MLDPQLAFGRDLRSKVLNYDIGQHQFGPSLINVIAEAMNQRIFFAYTKYIFFEIELAFQHS